MSSLVPDETPQRLIDAAGPLFAARGRDGVGVREICQAAGANVAAVNYHFGDKSRLYLATVREAARQCIENVPLPAWPDGVPATERLADFIRTLLERVVVEHGPEWHKQLIMREVAMPSDACIEFVRDFIRPQFQVLRGIVLDLLGDEAPEEQVRLTAFSIVGQCLFYRLARPIVRNLSGEVAVRQLSADRLAAHIAGFSLAALGVHGATARGGSMAADSGEGHS